MSRALDFQIRYGNADELDNYDPVGDVYDNQQFIGGTQYLVFSRPSFDTTSQQTILSDEIGTIGTDRDRSSNFVLRADSSASTFRFVGTSPFDSVKVWEYNGASWSYIDATTSGSYITLTSGYYYKGLDRIVDNQVADRTSFEDYDTILPIYISTRGDGIEVTDCSVVETLNAPWDAVLNDHKGYRKGRMFTGDPNERIEYSTAIPALRNDGDYLELAFKSHSNLENDTYCISSENFRYIQISALIRLSAGGFTDRFNFQVGSADEFYSIKKIRFDRISNVNVTCTISYDNGAVDVKPPSLQGSPDLDANPFDVKWLGEWNGREWKGVIEYLNVNGTVYNDDNDFGGTATTTNIARIPYSIADNTVSALGSSELSYTGKYKFNAYRINNDAAYFDTDSYLTPVSGTISGYSITESYGTATFTMSGNNIACTSSGSCNGIKLDNGNWYTFNEGIFGNNSSYVYDVSGSGIHLQINGQTAAQTWQVAGGVTDLGYDWRTLYGGHRYTNGTASQDIFIPHIVNTDNVPTESLLPGGYSIQTDFDSGKWVYSGTEWMLASGQTSQYRSELDAHEMGVTPFTQSYGHYIRETTSKWDRIVIYPDNLSEAANTLVDFNNQGIDSVVGITYQIADIKQLTNINSSYSKKFRLPATQQNNDLFDYPYDPNNANFSALRAAKDAEIIVNGQEILRGKASINKAYKQDIATGYDMTIFGDSYNVFSQLEDLAISGLDLGTFTLSKTNIETSWNYTAASGNAVFAPIDYGTYRKSGQRVDDMTPSFFIKNIITNAFGEIGVAYESSFFDSDLMNRLVMPFTGEWVLPSGQVADLETANYFNATGSTTASGLITVSGTTIATPFAYDSETTSNPNFNLLTGVLTASGNYSANFTFSFTASIQSNSVTLPIDIAIERNGTSVISQQSGRVMANQLPQDFTIETGVIKIEDGDSIRVTYKCDNQGVVVELTDTNFTVNITDTITEGSTITLNQFLPENVTAMQLLKGVSEMFNLRYAYINRILYIEPYDDFYATDLDWSDKIDESKDAEYRFLTNHLTRNIKFDYLDDETDKYLQSYQSSSGKKYGNYHLELPTNFLKGTKELTNSVFAATIDRKNTDGVRMATLAFASDTGVNDSASSKFNYKPRILFYEGKNSDGTFNMRSGFAGNVTKTTYGYLPRLAFSAGTSSSTFQSLAFDTFNDGFNERKGLFEQYYAKYYNDLQVGLVAQYYVNLDEIDIKNNPLNKRIWLDDTYWIISKIIDYKPLSNEPTKVELLRYQNLKVSVVPTPTKYLQKIFGDNLINNVKNDPQIGIISPDGFSDPLPSGWIDSDHIGNIGFVMGDNNEAPEYSGNYIMGEGNKTYYNKQTIVGRYNELNADAIFQVGAGMGDDSRRNAFEVEYNASGVFANVDGYKVHTDGHAYSPNGLISQFKTFTASGTTAGDGTINIYPTFDGTSTGISYFNDITHITATVFDGSNPYVVTITNKSNTQIVFRVVDLAGTVASGISVFTEIKGS